MYHKMGSWGGGGGGGGVQVGIDHKYICIRTKKYFGQLQNDNVVIVNLDLFYKAHQYISHKYDNPSTSSSVVGKFFSLVTRSL